VVQFFPNAQNFHIETVNMTVINQAAQEMKNEKTIGEETYGLMYEHSC